MATIDIKELQDILVDILSAFHDFCNRNNLTYALGYGTCLGAIRHKDLIPWDNDADVIMPRPDYDRLIEITKQQNIAEHYKAVSIETQSDYPYTYVKIIDTRTLVEEKIYKPYPLGIFIDVFPMDGLPSASDKEEAVISKSRFNQFMLFGSFGRYEKRGTGFWDYTLGCIGTFFLHRVYKTARKHFITTVDKLCKSTDYDSSEYISCIALIEYNPHEKYLKRDIFPTTTATIRGKEFNIPNNYDSYLSSLYGDYMQLPPEDERKVHDFKAEWIQK